jgi:putative Holliday junction resolvase
MASVVRRPEISNSNDHGEVQTKPGRILALDYGRKRIGLAVSDLLWLTASPQGILERQNRQKDMAQLKQVARENSVCKVIVGHPIHMDGTASEMAEEAERFAARVGKELGILVELVDERLTSWAAEELAAGARRGTRRRGDRSVDDLAAAVLLRDYLETGYGREGAGSGERTGTREHGGKSGGE